MLCAAGCWCCETFSVDCLQHYLFVVVKLMIRRDKLFRVADDIMEVVAATVLLQLFLFHYYYHYNYYYLSLMSTSDQAITYKLFLSPFLIVRGFLK